jgi:hypothetical protein
VWHKDGPVAQIRAMADWCDPGRSSLATLSAETQRKVAANLRAAADEVVPVAEVERLREALRAEAATLRALYGDPHNGTLIAANEMADKLEALANAS